jgi:hypothetical protein
MKKTFFCFWLCIIALTTTSCKSIYTASSTYTLMSGSNVKLFLTVTNKISIKNSMRMSDELYAIPTAEWVKNEFTPQFKKFLIKYNLMVFRTIENDCDKYSHYGRTVSRIMHKNIKNKPPYTAIPIGELDYMRTKTDAHSINFFIVRDEFNEIKLMFYDPQCQKIISFKINTFVILNINI